MAARLDASFTIRGPSDRPGREADVRAVAVGTADILKGVAPETLVLSTLSGGITNELYRAKDPASGRSVVVRVFGAETERLISREGELFWQSLFLRTYARVSNGLVYEFLDDHDTVQPDGIAALGPQVAEALAEMHVTCRTRTMLTLPYATQSNHITMALTEWRDIVFAPETQSKYSAAQRAVMDGPMGGAAVLKEECAWLAAAVGALSPLLPESPGHNDLLPLNVMRHRGTGKLRLIDFEYARRTYVHFEFANHFVEYAGVDCDWTRYPSTAQQRAFFDAYRARSAALAGEPEDSANSTPLSDGEFEQWAALVNFLTLASHLAWSIWALVQGAFSEIEFDYVDYGNTRFTRYLATKGALSAAVTAATGIDIAPK